MSPDSPSEFISSESSACGFEQPQFAIAQPRPKALHFLILAALAVLPYLNSLRNGFVYDDFDQVLSNPYIRDFHHLHEIFTSSVWSFMGDFRGSTNYYRPMMSLGYLVSYHVFGLRPWGYHLGNMLANVCVVLLVFLVTRRMFRSNAIGLAAACIFALHPIHSEVVDWIAAVTELELALFYLLTFWFFLVSARPGGNRSVPLQAAMTGSFALALLSKEQALTLPLLAAVYEHFVREDRSTTTPIQKIRRYYLLWVLPLLYLGLRIRYLGRFAPSLERPELSKRDLLISALALIGQYCWKLVWPFKLCAYYLFPAHMSAVYPWAIRGTLALLICALVFATLWNSNRTAAFGMIWAFVVLLPVLNVRWMTSNAFAERYLYLASAGYCWMVGWAWVRAWNLLAARRKAWTAALALAAGVLAVLCIVRIFTRNRDWHDNLTFYTATLRISPDAYYMHNNLGTVYWQMGDLSAAKREWITALKLAPGSEYVLHNLGLVANAEEQYPRAKVFFSYALKLRPNYMDAHLDLGKTYEAMGQLDEAEAQFLIAEKLSPLSIRAHNTLSEFYLDRRRLGEAEAEARRSVEIEPTIQGEWDLGLAEWMQENRTGTERAFLDALALNPSSARAHFMLGLFYMDSSRNADAIREYRAGLKIDPANPDAIANLKKLEFMEALHE